MTELVLKKGAPVDKALRRLKKKIERKGTLKEARNYRHFEKPSERRRRKMKAARFSAMLSARYADKTISARNIDPVQKAFQGGYPGFVDVPVKRIESSWSKIGDSLDRMERKLEAITG